MKVLLMSTPTRTNAPNTYPPLGIMYIAGYLQTNGHESKILDLAKNRLTTKEIIDEISKYNPDVIGISGIVTAFRYILSLVPEIKQIYPHIPIVIGGHITLDIEEILLRQVGCDICIRGYGELKFAAILDFIAGKIDIEEIHGIAYLDNDEFKYNCGDLFFSDIDECPLPAYDLIDLDYYATASDFSKELIQYSQKSGKLVSSLRWFPIISSRGCIAKCTFCIHEYEGYNRYVRHSIEYIINNISVLYNKYHIRFFDIGGEMFFYNIKTVKDFAKSMNSCFPEAFFRISTRANIITPDFIEVLSHTNCSMLDFGFESGSKSILKTLKKGITREQNINAYKLIKQSVIVPQCSFLVGSPGETKETIKETTDAIREAGVQEAGLFFTTPYPGSRLYRWCIENGYIKDIPHFLDQISDRDASILTINLTKYPNYIVRCMRKQVRYSFKKNMDEFKYYDINIIKTKLLDIISIISYQIYFFIESFILVLSKNKNLD